jgi:HK97 family phage major capsid protein
MSDFIAKQTEAKAKAWHEAKALIDSVEARGGVWTGEDEAKYASLTAEINRRNEAIEVEQREAKTAEVVANAAVNFAGATVSDNEHDVLRKMALGELRSYEFRAITPSTSGAPVPTSLFSEVVKVARLVNPLLDYATVINTASGENLQIPSQSAFSTATIKAAGSAIATSEPTFNSFTTLGAWKFSALSQLARELVLDSGVDIVGFLADQFGNAFGYAIGDKLINGTGTVEPTGILGAAASAITGGTGVSGQASADNIVDLVYSLDGALRAKPSFAILANSTTISQIRKLKDSYGRYLFDIGVGQDKRDLVLGVPVIETPAMPSAATGVKSILCGDLKSVYVRNAGGLQVDRSEDYAFANDLVTWRATWRLDGALVQTNNIKYFKGGAS